MRWGFNIPLFKVGSSRYGARAKLTRRGVKVRGRAGWFWFGSGSSRRRRRRY